MERTGRPSADSAFGRSLADQPIKEARKALEKQERMRYDLARMKLEAQHGDAVKARVR